MKKYEINVKIVIDIDKMSTRPSLSDLTEIFRDLCANEQWINDVNAIGFAKIPNFDEPL